MGIMVYSLLWIVQDFVHQPYVNPDPKLCFATGFLPVPASMSEAVAAMFLMPLPFEVFARASCHVIRSDSQPSYLVSGPPCIVASLGC